VGEGLRLFRAGAPFETALGLAPGWRTAAAAQRQAQTLSRLVAGRTGSRRAIAEEIATEIRSYTAAAWRVDREAGRRPAGRVGDLFDFLTANGPTSADRIRRLGWVTETDAVTQRAG
jgi:hypothetical protein